MQVTPIVPQSSTTTGRRRRAVGGQAGRQKAGTSSGQPKLTTYFSRTTSSQPSSSAADSGRQRESAAQSGSSTSQRSSSPDGRSGQSGTGAGQSGDGTSSRPQTPPAGGTTSIHAGTQSPGQGPLNSQGAAAVPQSVSQTTEDLSLSRCTVFMGGFLPHVWYQTDSSPGRPNLCDCGIRFVMQPYAAELYSIIRQSSPQSASSDLASDNVCERSPQAAVEAIVAVEPKYKDMEVNTVLSMEGQMEQFYPAPLAASEVATIKAAIKDMNVRYIKISELDSQRRARLAADARAEKERQWNAMLLDMRKDGDIWPVQWLEKNKERVIDWLEWFPSSVPGKTHEGSMRCRLCRKHEKGNQEQQRPAMATSTGIRRSNSNYNRDAITAHMGHKWHHHAEIKEAELEKEQITTAVATAVATEGNRLNELQKSTAAMFRVIYAETKAFVPFNSHDIVIGLLETLDVKLGSHSQTRKAPPVYLHQISTEYQRTLMQYLQKEKPPMSLILDSATDSVGIEHVALLLQTLEYDKPVVYFLRLVKIGVDTTAEGYKTLIKEALLQEKDRFGVDLYELFKTTLVGFASDGLSTFVGHIGGLGVLLSTELHGNKDKIYRVHCLPHRLNLAGRALVDRVPALHTFEDNIKSIARFVNNQSPRNLEFMTNVARAYCQRLPRITYTFTERWATSEKLVLHKLRHALPVLIRGYAQYQEHPDFRDDQKAIANGLKSIASDRTFVLLVHFMADVLNTLSFFSLQFQKSAGILIGKEKDRAALVRSVEALKENDGTVLSEFISQLQCRKSDDRIGFTDCRTVKTVLASKYVRWVTEPDHAGDTATTFSPSTGTRTRQTYLYDFTALRPAIIDNLKQLLDNYFPEGSYADFDVLDPEKFNKDSCVTRTYGLNSIRALSQRLGVPPTATVTEWQALMYNLGNRDDFDIKTAQSPAQFWATLLQDPAMAASWGPNIKKLVRIVLALPASSAEAERVNYCFHDV